MRPRSLALIAFASITVGSQATTAQAGPLIDWLFGGRQTQPAYAVGAPVPLGNGYGSVPGYAANYPAYGYGAYSAGYAPMSAYAPSYAANVGNYYNSRLPVIGPNGAGYTVAPPAGITAATLPQMPQTMTYVPNYSSSALRAPVTYYRPLLTTDPNTGSQVVAMAPCTSYQYLTQRVPALGQSALYGSYPAPQPIQAQPMPSYTLPSGGIPLAQGSVVGPSYGGAVLGYSPYSTYQVSPPAVSGLQGYPTAPTGSTYYNAPSGGCSGSYSQPIPGLSAAPAPTYSAPTYSTPVPASPSYTAPGTSIPGYSPSTTLPPSYSTPGVYPPATGLSDPANLQPSLPPSSTLRPQLKSIIPEVSPSGSESARNVPSLERSMLSDPARELPVTKPIPAPEGMEKPSWTPGLLRSEDMTALRPVTRSAQYAGQSKKIHWASFQEELALEPSAVTQAVAAEKNVAAPSTTRLRNADRSTVKPVVQAPATASPAPVRYQTGGWKSSR